MPVLPEDEDLSAVMRSATNVFIGFVKRVRELDHENKTLRQEVQKVSQARNDIDAQCQQQSMELKQLREQAAVREKELDRKKNLLETSQQLIMAKQVFID